MQVVAARHQTCASITYRTSCHAMAQSC
jgi:hypothetical protein